MASEQWQKGAPEVERLFSGNVFRSTTKRRVFVRTALRADTLNRSFRAGVPRLPRMRGTASVVSCLASDRKRLDDSSERAMCWHISGTLWRL